MNKPYVICHMLTSIDGKIDGAWFGAPQVATGLKFYGQQRPKFNCEATIYGTTTMAGSYSDGLAGKLPHSNTVLPKEDYIAQPEFGNYIVSFDPEGVLGFNGPYIEKKGRAKAHIIEVLTEKVSNDYLNYLRKNGISYIFAGKEIIDCKVVLEKINTLFGVKRAILAGGGVTDWFFAKDGLIDELSIVVAPVTDGSTSAVSIFEDITDSGKNIAYTLKSVENLGDSTLWLRYVK